MSLKKSYRQLAIALFITLWVSETSWSQCFQIESILVDACGAQEGLNEMVRYQTGAIPLNTSTLTVNWPNNPWQNLVQNATTAAKVAALNADILDAGGCGQLIEPVGGILPANTPVILVTSYNMDTALNSFGALTENIYILFQNNPNTVSGHFANSGTGLRTLTMSFGGACSDTVTYDRSLLVDPDGNTVAADGATVLFGISGTPTYVNYGCSAPVEPFLVDVGIQTLNACAGTTISLNGSVQGEQSVNWSASSGTFSNPTGTSTNYTIGADQAGNTIIVTLTATNICGLEISDSVSILVTNSITPDFATALTLCSGNTAPLLNSTSPNGIIGSWSPATISNTADGTYTFTPNTGQCASSVTLIVDVTNSITPNFATSLTLCSGNTAPLLNTTSPNGIIGSWNPATISNTADGTYTFTPNTGQCAVQVTLTVDVTNSITPNFATALTLCSGNTAPLLNTTSPNGIIGSWSPATISNTADGTYTFTPNTGQCATQVTLTVDVTNSITPDFATALTLCSGTTAPLLNSTSPNGIIGSWSPAIISNTADGTYTFTPNTGQCASSVTLIVDVTSSITPNFATALTLCSGTTAPVLNTTSPNGIIGSWSPATISNTADGTYTFTPNTGQCAVQVTLTVDVTTSIMPNFATSLTLCSGTTAPVLNTTSPNGIIGSWNPATISNTADGTYVFTPNTGQCAVQVTLTVDVTNSTTPDFATSLTLCSGNTAPLLNTTSPNDIIGSWSPAIISNTADGTYTFTPNTGQCAAVLNFVVTIDTVGFALKEECINNELIIQAIPSNGTTDLEGLSFAWKNQQGNLVGSDDPFLNVSDLVASVNPISFPTTFELVITTESGCEFKDDILIYGTFCTIPKGISPNNDDKNDSFDLSGLGVQEINIFNRYGTKVYSRTNYTNQWKGQSDRGDELPVATYFYVINKTNGESVTGWVYLNR